MNYRQAKKKFLNEHGFNPPQITWFLESNHFEEALDSFVDACQDVVECAMEIDAILEVFCKLGQWIH